MNRPILPIFINLILLLPFIWLAELTENFVIPIPQHILLHYTVALALFFSGSYAQLFLSPTRPGLYFLCFMLMIYSWLLSIQTFLPISLFIIIPYACFILLDYKSYKLELISINYLIFKFLINITIVFCIGIFIINNFHTYQFIKSKTKPSIPTQHSKSPMK